MKSKDSLWLTQLIRSNKLPNPIYQTECKNQIYWTKFTKPNLQNWIYKIKFTNQNVLNAKNQIYQTKSIQSNLQNKINPIITIKSNLDKPKLQTVKVKSNSSLSWAWPSSAPACWQYLSNLDKFGLNFFRNFDLSWILVLSKQFELWDTSKSFCQILFLISQLTLFELSLQNKET